MLRKKLAKWLKILREEEGITLEKLAYENGLTKGKIRDWVYGGED